MTEKSEHQPSADEIWRLYLTGGPEALDATMPRLMRSVVRTTSQIFNLLPSDPRCIWCGAPFHGPGAPLMRALGRGQSKYHPSICGTCEGFVRDNHGGAEVELAMLFADVRGSTTLAENMSPTEFGKLINLFYEIATEVLVDSDAFIDKLIGDEVVAFYVPGFAGPEYVRRAIEAAEELLQRLEGGGSERPRLPVGAGVHAGVAYVGVIAGASGLTDITVLGDVANTASRLASAARGGELLVSEDAWRAAKIEGTPWDEERRLQLKGRSQPVAVKVIRVGNNRFAQD